ATDVYFENHEHGTSEKFKKNTLKRWKNIYDVTGGDIALADVTPRDGASLHQAPTNYRQDDDR
ncbi:hypothetical protein, partial [Polynucleobacter sp. AP-Nickl1-40-C4]|uniref:hypothetical protein n=1 Tax=Polynucleobacter sp. AP-Nickl1-40-C4 TaxID=3108275 RepID=UPI002B22FB37